MLSHMDQSYPLQRATRRSFLGMSLRASATAIGAAAMQSTSAQSISGTAGKTARPSSFFDLLRSPDAVMAYGSFAQTLPSQNISLQRKGDQWQSGQTIVEASGRDNALELSLSAPGVPVALVQVRWSAQLPVSVRCLGDAWERSYGELGWRDLVPERVMPWYFATHDGVACHAYGVKTDAAALCSWSLDAEGVSLWLNVTNGGNGVELGSRRLTMARVVTRHGVEGEHAVDAIADLCRAMCSRASRPLTPVYGANDWNYSYGASTAQSILRDTEFIVDVSPSGGVRPFSVIDGGWSNGTAAWPDMGQLAQGIRQRGARPGIWIRPLEAPQDAARALLLPDARFGARQDRARAFAWDPTHPDAQGEIRAKVVAAKGWGYEMVKHDFSTYDLLGQWGFEMGPQPTLPGWSLHDRTRTNAEVIADLYALIRTAAGNQVLLDGCNTIGHLAQGIFDLQRTGDDTSGRHWERTRRMGVNTLAFRLPQHGTFYVIDPDMIGITEAVPWEFNRQWLDVVARSGAATMVAAGPPARGKEQRAALREAFRIAASGGTELRPLDWLETSAPEQWESKSNAAVHYRWSGADGASPFLSA